MNNMFKNMKRTLAGLMATVTLMTVSSAMLSAASADSLYGDGDTYENGDVNGSYAYDIGKYDADAGVKFGAFTSYDNEKESHGYGLQGEVSAQVSVASANGDLHYGNDDYNVGIEAEGTALDARAKGSATAGMVDGKPVLNAEVGAEANLVEASTEVKGTVCGVEMGAGVGVKVGVGVNGGIGFEDGHFKMDLAAALGIGMEVSVDIDVASAAGKVADGATYVADKVADGTTYVAEKVADGTTYVAEKVADGATYAAGKVADGVSYAAEKVADGVSYAASKIADGASAVYNAIKFW